MQSFRVLSLVLLLTASTAEAASASFEASSAMRTHQVPGTTSADIERCPLRAKDLDTLTPYRWRFGQFRADSGFLADPSIRLDMCELIGRDAKGVMRTGVMVNIATGAHAGAYARHLRATCADSIVREVRGTVRPVPDVPGGQQCVTPTGGSSLQWIESPGRTVEVEIENEDAALAARIPQVLAAIVR